MLALARDTESTEQSSRRVCVVAIACITIESRATIPHCNADEGNETTDAINRLKCIPKGKVEGRTCLP